MVFILVFLSVFIGTILIVWVARIIKVSEIRKRQIFINDKLKQSSTDFNVDKILYVDDNLTHNQDFNVKKQIYIDNQNKKLKFANYLTGTINEFSFNEILDYEVYENSRQQSDGIGAGTTFGRLGVGTYSSNTYGMCRNLKLIIRTKNQNLNQIVYEIVGNTIFNAGLKKTSNIFEKCMSSVQEVISLIKYIKNQNGDDKEVLKKEKPLISTSDEIKKYKGLLDDGIITQEEFEKKKKELL